VVAVVLTLATALSAFAAPARILFVHGALHSEDGGDPELLRLLSDTFGYDVHRRLDSAGADPVTDARDFDAVFISASVSSKNVGKTYREHSLPVLVSEGLLFSDEWMAMAKKSRSEKRGPHLATIRLVPESLGHSLAAGKFSSPVPVSSGKLSIWSWGANLGPGAKIIATSTVDPTDGETTAPNSVVEMLYEKDALLTDGSRAQGLRLGITWIDSEGPLNTGRPDYFTPDARELIRAAFEYALGQR
jgi:hypothetical protein